jgi:hypothetical protein
VISDAQAKKDAKKMTRLGKRLAQHEDDEMGQPAVQRAKKTRTATRGKQRS